MPSLHTQKLGRWGRVAVVAAVAVTAVWAFVLISPAHELDSEAFLARAFAHSAEVRSAHFTQFGSVTMSNGVVHYWSGEGDLVYTGDSQGYIEYEGCTVPMERDVHLCRSEWVVWGGIRYERQNTSEGPGEWEIVENVQTRSTDSDTPHDLAEVPEFWSRSYGLGELNSETTDGVEYRRFRATYSPSRRVLERLKAGEWEPSVGVPWEALIESLQGQAEAETVTRELWARADDSTIWRVVTERDRLDASTSVSFRSFASRKTYDVLEYSRYNESVVIKPPV